MMQTAVSAPQRLEAGLSVMINFPNRSRLFTQLPHVGDPPAKEKKPVMIPLALVYSQALSSTSINVLVV